MDSLVRAMIFDNEVSVVACSTTAIVNKAIQSHDLSPTPSAALGRLLTAAAMMTTELKNEDDSLTISINGGGAIGNLVVSAQQNACVRGYVDNPHAEAPIKENGKLNVGGVVGKNGSITVVKSDGMNKPYVGMSALCSGEIAEDITQYYASSEQKTTAVSLGVLVSKEGKCISAGGIYIHVLPFASDETVKKIESVMASICGISNIFKEKTPMQFLSELFVGNINIVGELQPRFRCKCSQKSLERVLATLSKEELEQLKKEQGKIEVTCHFCSKKYEY